MTLWSTRKELPWTLVCGGLLVGLAVYLVFITQPASRVGDGAEYYLMTMAWGEKLQPYGDADLNLLYDQYRASRDGSFPSSKQVSEAFPDLVHNGQQDYPHFWFYSLLAAPFYWFAKLTGTDMAHSYTLLHFTLFGLLLIVARKHFGRRGIVLAALICLVSPMLWFIDKAHTEFFTVTLSLIGTIYFLKKEPALSFLAFSIVSTQNPPFGLIAIGVLAEGMISERRFFVRKSWVVAIGVLILGLHPLYYQLRYGSVTPQLITGAATTSAKGLRELTCFFIDPDVGLLANWPFIIVPLVAVPVVAAINRQRLEWKTIAFCVTCLLVLAWAQSKTMNFNHGGTIKVSRYALWYIPFLFPLLMQFSWNYRLVAPWQRVAVLLFLIAAVYVNSAKYNPSRAESYLFPTSFARQVYKQWPDLYDPIPEIFMERSIHSEAPWNSWAISNPSGTKIIIHRGRLRKQMNLHRRGKELDPIHGCEYELDGHLLIEYIQAEVELPNDLRWFYVNTAGDIRRSLNTKTEMAQHPKTPTRLR